MEYQLRPGDAKRLIRKILVEGTITYSLHASDRMTERDITIIDCENVLWAGKVKHPEWQNDAWRYRVVTGKIEVVIEIVSENEIVIVTAMKTG